jgi:hypothetical protein
MNHDLLGAGLSLAVIGCAQEPDWPRAQAFLPSSSSPAPASSASAPQSDAGSPVAPPPLAETSARKPDAAVSDAGLNVIRWTWTGTYEFTELCQLPAADAPRCPRYRIVIEKCPGPCKVNIDSDGPGTKVRLEGVAHGTANIYALEVRFSGYRQDDPSKSGFTAGAVLLTLERHPGDHVSLTFGQLQSPDKIESILVRVVPPFGPP